MKNYEIIDSIEDFALALKNEVSERLHDYGVEETKTLKNNGVELVGLILRSWDSVIRQIISSRFRQIIWA